jgi:hypothetical protein
MVNGLSLLSGGIYTICPVNRRPVVFYDSLTARLVIRPKWPGNESLGDSLTGQKNGRLSERPVIRRPVNGTPL